MKKPTGTRIEFSPAKLDRKPDPKKYYGVTSKGYSKPSEYIAPTRMFLVATDGYPNPSANKYRAITALGMTAGNTYQCLMEKPEAKLEAYILFLYEKGFQVIEFDTARDLFAWLSDCEDTLPIKRSLF